MSTYEKIRKAVEEKRKKYEEQGYADKDFEKTVDGLKIKMWLPESVFTQQTMLLLASKALESNSNDIDEFSKVKKRYAEAVAKHTRINGEDLNIEKVGYGASEAYCLMYWMELLSPLSAWADLRAEKILLS